MRIVFIYRIGMLFIPLNIDKVAGGLALKFVELPRCDLGRSRSDSEVLPSCNTNR